jgi:hypothetical protein
MLMMKFFRAIEDRTGQDRNTGLGCPPYPHQLNDPEDEDIDGLRNVGPYKTEPPYPADSPKELHHKHRDLLAGKASNCIKIKLSFLLGEGGIGAQKKKRR